MNEVEIALAKKIEEQMKKSEETMKVMEELLKKGKQFKK